MGNVRFMISRASYPSRPLGPADSSGRQAVGLGSGYGIGFTPATRSTNRVAAASRSGRPECPPATGPASSTARAAARLRPDSFFGHTSGVDPDPETALAG